MKTLMIALCSVMIFAVTTHAQTTQASQTDAAKMDKEAKAKAKQKQTEDISNALKQAGVTDDKIKEFLDASQTYSAKSNEVKKNAALSEDERTKQLQAITDEKNAKLKEILGADKYKEFNKIRKQQKEKDAAANPGGN